MRMYAEVDADADADANADAKKIHLLIRPCADETHTMTEQELPSCLIVFIAVQ